MSGRALSRIRPDYYLNVKSVEIHESSWRRIRRGWSGNPNLYVKMEYRKEKVSTKTVKGTLSPQFPDNQIVIKSSSSPEEEVTLKLTVFHDSVSQIDITVGQLEICLQDIRKQTKDGKAQLRIISKRRNNAVGTITIHCEPVDYRQLISKTQDVVAHNAKAMPTTNNRSGREYGINDN